MKNLSLILNVVLFVAVGALYFMHFSGGSNNTVQAGQAVAAGKGAVVYINTDSLLRNYELSKDLNEKFLKKQEASRTDLNVKARKLEQEAGEFQRKLQNNGFLSRQRAEQAQRDLMEKQQKLQNLERKLTTELMEEQNQMSKRLHDTLTNYLKELNATKQYDLVISTTLGGNVLHSKAGLDITNDVINALNSRYKK
ncbi:MAG: OmpH family outer membrane protein [Marinifilaceae bacterium]